MCALEICFTLIIIKTLIYYINNNIIIILPKFINERLKTIKNLQCFSSKLTYSINLIIHTCINAKGLIPVLTQLSFSLIPT